MNRGGGRSDDEKRSCTDVAAFLWGPMGAGTYDDDDVRIVNRLTAGVASHYHPRDAVVQARAVRGKHVACERLGRQPIIVVDVGRHVKAAHGRDHSGLRVRRWVHDLGQFRVRYQPACGLVDLNTTAVTVRHGYVWSAHFSL